MMTFYVKVIWFCENIRCPLQHFVHTLKYIFNRGHIKLWDSMIVRRPASEFCKCFFIFLIHSYMHVVLKTSYVKPEYLFKLGPPGLPGMEGLRGLKGDRGFPGEIGEIGPVVKGEKGKFKVWTLLPHGFSKFSWECICIFFCVTINAVGFQIVFY